jgi:hypothetical protein
MGGRQPLRISFRLALANVADKRESGLAGMRTETNTWPHGQQRRPRGRPTAGSPKPRDDQFEFEFGLDLVLDGLDKMRETA